MDPLFETLARLISVARLVNAPTYVGPDPRVADILEALGLAHSGEPEAPILREAVEWAERAARGASDPAPAWLHPVLGLKKGMGHKIGMDSGWKRADAWVGFEHANGGDRVVLRRDDRIDATVWTVERWRSGRVCALRTVGQLRPYEARLPARTAALWRAVEEARAAWDRFDGSRIADRAEPPVPAADLPDLGDPGHNDTFRGLGIEPADCEQHADFRLRIDAWLLAERAPYPYRRLGIRDADLGSSAPSGDIDGASVAEPPQMGAPSACEPLPDDGLPTPPTLLRVVAGKSGLCAAEGDGCEEEAGYWLSLGAWVELTGCLCADDHDFYGIPTAGDCDGPAA